jgi:hypothetical protein
MSFSLTFVKQEIKNLFQLTPAVVFANICSTRYVLKLYQLNPAAFFAQKLIKKLFKLIPAVFFVKPCSLKNKRKISADPGMLFVKHYSSRNEKKIFQLTPVVYFANLCSTRNELKFTIYNENLTFNE